MSPPFQRKIGLAQINTTVGDLSGNRQKIIETYHKLVKDGAELVIFPELVVTGYPPRDLVLKRRFVDDSEASLREIANEIGPVPAVVGYVAWAEGEEEPQISNAAAFLVEGEVKAVARKCLLPTYDVFDEARYFRPADQPVIVEHEGYGIGITICEDIWTHPDRGVRLRYDRDPVGDLAARQPDLVVNLSASPWHVGKTKVREEIVAEAARRCQCPVVYVNAIGGNDELIFDGHSLVAHGEGQLLTGLEGFREEIRVVDPGDAYWSPHYIENELDEVRDALVLGVRDYAHKSGFKRALIGLSGGIDSAVTAALAAEALGSESVIGVSLPSAISSEHSKSDAEDLARNLGIRFETLSIAGIVEAAGETLAPLFAGTEPDVTEENIQARSRGLLLMALSNKFGALLLTTGNKSELAVGYCTLYGDMCGGLAVISDLPKMDVYALARQMNRDREVIPVSTIKKPPSAELRPDQKDEDSLPPYPVLDEILRLYVEEMKSGNEIIEVGYVADVVRDIIAKVDRNEYKRKQAAPGLKVRPVAFGVGRRIPIVQRYVEESRPPLKK